MHLDARCGRSDLVMGGSGGQIFATARSGSPLPSTGSSPQHAGGAGGGQRPGHDLRHFPPASRPCVEAISGFSRATRSPGAAALGTTVEVAIFFVGEGRPAVGGGGSIDLSPHSGGMMEELGSRRRCRRWWVGVASPGWSPTWGSDLYKGGGPRASLA
jgi:hypothetical protein